MYKKDFCYIFFACSLFVAAVLPIQRHHLCQRLQVRLYPRQNPLYNQRLQV